VNKFITLLTALLLLGCKSIQQMPVPDWQYTWYQSDRQPLPMVVHYSVDYDVVRGYCPHVRGVIACAVFRDNVCDVYTHLEQLNEHIIMHEQQHCDGKDHHAPKGF